MKQLRAVVVLGALVVTACSEGSWRDAVPTGWPYSLDTEPVTASNGMVVSTNRYASAVGVRILETGGNAVDAAVATAFALAVVNPEAGNIGGGGFIVLRLADGTTTALDFRERAPAAASRDMYLDESGELTDGSTVGHRAVGVPGTVAGLWEAHKRHGSLEWSYLVAPAVALADGFALTNRGVKSMSYYAEALTQFAHTSAIFLDEGNPFEVGDTLVQADLAGTLRRIQQQGRAGFYEGETARLIVEEMRRGDGLITLDDLASYQPAWREPIQFTYRDHHIISMPPSSTR